MTRKIIPLDDYNGIIPPADKWDFVGSITTMWGRNAFRAGWKLIEINKDMAKRYRIRKLTSRECFRFMGVHDDDIDKIKAAGISESQQYKMAGNSIVVPVLEGIFTQMFRVDDDALF
jgi:site-specific DNA-cytosine methylase